MKKKNHSGCSKASYCNRGISKQRTFREQNGVQIKNSTWVGGGENKRTCDGKRGHRDDRTRKVHQVVVERKRALGTRRRRLKGSRAGGGEPGKKKKKK